MQEKIDKMIEELKQKFEEVKTMQNLNDLKVAQLGKKGSITELSAAIKEIPNEQKKAYGEQVNRVRAFFNEKFAEVQKKIEEEISIVSFCNF